ncbi:MAG: FlgD immunoglobulin-like domain containing protein [Bacteroidota bacterium]
MKKYRVFLVFLFFCGISCSTPSEPSDPERLTFSLSEIPVIKGFYRTDAAGHILGYIGQPPEKQEFPDGVNLIIVPNYGANVFHTEFALPFSGRVLIVVAKASFMGYEQNTSVGGAAVLGSQKIIVRTLLNQRLEAGIFTVEWDGKDDDGYKLASGFYRIYYVTKDFTVWGDTFYAKNPGDKPPFIP